MRMQFPVEYRLMSIAHIPPETAFRLGTQREEKVHKQHEIDMPDANPMRTCPTQTIFHCLVLGLALGWLGFMLGILGFALGPRGFVLVPQGFLDTGTNMLVQVRGDVKINRLQPPYSAASCSQFI